MIAKRWLGSGGVWRGALLVATALFCACAPFAEGDATDAGAPDAPALDGGIEAGARCPNGALEFARNGYVEVPANAAFDSPGDLTVEAWIFPSPAIKPFDEAHIVSHHHHDKDEGYVLMLFGELKFRVYSSSGGGGATEVTGDPVTPGVWHHVAGVFDTSSRQGRIYIDGRGVTSVSATRTRADPYAGPLRIGLSAADDGFPYVGIIDEVRVSAAARYNGDFDPAYPLPDAEPGTIATWHFSEQNGPTATSANGLVGRRAALPGAPVNPLPKWTLATCPKPPP